MINATTRNIPTKINVSREVFIKIFIKKRKGEKKP